VSNRGKKRGSKQGIRKRKKKEVPAIWRLNVALKNEVVEKRINSKLGPHYA